MSVGYLVDVFDLVNVRDLDLIAQARARCKQLVLGVLTDEHAERVFGRRPVITLSERITILRHVRGVSDVVVHDDTISQDADVVFAADDGPGPTSNETVWLTPGRHSRSSILRGIFAPIGQECVA